MNTTEYRPLTIKDWILTLIILALPLVNLIMLIVWSVSTDTHPSKRSYAQASLIIMGAVIVLGIVFMVLALLLGVGLQGLQQQ